MSGSAISRQLTRMTQKDAASLVAFQTNLSGLSYRGAFLWRWVKTESQVFLVLSLVIGAVTGWRWSPSSC
jgi:hypothetical protein